MSLKELNKSIALRIAKGESKTAIYKEYIGHTYEKQIIKTIALIPTPELKSKYKNLNLVIIYCLILMAFIKTVTMFATIVTTMPEAWYLIVISPLINIILCWAIYKSYSVSYLITAAICMNPLANIGKGFEGSVNFIDIAINSASLILLIITFAVAIYTKSKIFPSSKFFLAPKKDASGAPQFEN